MQALRVCRPRFPWGGMAAVGLWGCRVGLGHTCRMIRFLTLSFTGKAACRAVLLCAGLVVLPAAWAQQGTLVRVVTSAGPVDIRLHDASAPRTVANFLAYVRSGAFNSSLFHRLLPGFALQGGGLTWNAAAQPALGLVPTFAPIANEFSPLRSNLRGTVAMAKQPGDPDSATSQWFVNLADNATNLDAQNGGFTVFGAVTAPGMAVVDVLAALPKVDAKACTNLGEAAVALAQVPMLVRPADCNAVSGSHLVLMQSVRELPPRHTLAHSERVFDYLEAAFPKWAAPASPPTQQGSGFVYRYYAQTQTYLAVMGNEVLALAPALSPQVLSLGALADWMALAQGVGY